jgi:hypothetical protein
MKKYGFFLLLLLLAVKGYTVPAPVIPPFEEGIYKDWNYSPGQVFGIIKLTSTANRSYYKITRPDNQSAKIQEYNPSGFVTATIVIRFVNGKLNSMARTDRWGDTYETTRFALSGTDQFIVTRRNTGKNDFSPCKGARYIYRNNLLAEIRYLSYTNKLSSNANGVAIIKYKRYDDKNRYSLVKEQAFYDVDGKPVISRSSDCHKIVYEYDEKGNQVSVAYYGTGNEPLTNRFGGFKSRYRYDESNRMTESAIIGINDEVIANAYGVARTEYEYKNGWSTRQTRFNENNTITKASAAGDGIAIIKYEYNDAGDEITRAYFDENNSPMNGNSGYQKIVYDYSPSHMLTGSKYFDKYGSAVADVYGIHRYSYERDGKGNIIQEAFYDKDNNPIKDQHDEVYMRKYKYDEYGRETTRSFWKDNATKMVRWNGYHEQVNKYNEEGQVTESIYLDESGNLFTSSSGYSRLMVFYNSNAQMSERKCMNGNEPAKVVNSFVQDYSSVRYYYDNNGRVSSVKYFDTDNKPVNASIGLDELTSHKIEYIYKGNRIVEEKFYPVGSDVPSRIIDCLKNDYVTTSGINKGYKNQ